MKRLNPETGKPFVHGDKRQDGYVFLRYESRLKKDGTQVETWLHPETYTRYMTKERVYQQKRHVQKGMKLRWGWREEIGENKRLLANCRELWYQINNGGLSASEIEARAASLAIRDLLLPYANGV